jgi:hypothetical protein
VRLSRRCVERRSIGQPDCANHSAKPIFVETRGRLMASPWRRATHGCLYGDLDQYTKVGTPTYDGNGNLTFGRPPKSLLLTRNRPFRPRRSAPPVGDSDWADARLGSKECHKFQKPAIVPRRCNVDPRTPVTANPLKTSSWNPSPLRAMIAFGLAAFAALLAPPESRAQTPSPTSPPATIPQRPVEPGWQSLGGTGIASA